MHRDEVNTRTIQSRFWALQTVLAAQRGVCAMRDKLIAFNPCATTELPHVPDRDVAIYEPDEVDALLDSLDPWWVPLIATDVDPGVRWCELMGLQVDDFTFDYRQVSIKRTILQLTKRETGNGTVFKTKDCPKGKRQRTFSVSPEVSELLAAIVEERDLKLGDRLFSMPDTTPPPEWHPPLSLI